MLTNKISMYSLVAAVACCVLWAAHRHGLRNEARSVSRETVSTLQHLLKSAPPNLRVDRPLDGNRSAVFEKVDDLYLQTGMRKRPALVPAESLIKLAECLRSGDSELRSYCQDLSLYMLSDWTFNRPEAEWHIAPEVDAFFRIFKASGYAKLEAFLDHRAGNHERRYLNQI